MVSSVFNLPFKEDLFLLFLIICMFVSVWGYVNVSIHASEGNIDPSGTGVTRSCELSHLTTGNQTQCLCMNSTGF